MGGLAIGHNAPAPSGIITHAEPCPAWELLHLVGIVLLPGKPAL